MTEEGHDSGYINKQVWIQSSSAPDIFAILFHVNLLDTFPTIGTTTLPSIGHTMVKMIRTSVITVSSGEVLGYADLRGTISDIAILKKISDTEYHYVSYFDETIMTDSVFAIYQRYGLTNRDDVIITREFRNSHPLPEDCWGRSRKEDWFSLSEADGVGVDESNDAVFRLSLEEPSSMARFIWAWAICAAGLFQVKI